MSKLQRIQPATYLLPKEGEMRVPGLIIASEELLGDTDIEKPLEQVRNVACLPGIVGHSIAMPDMHWGYGFPIGGVAAMCMETGVISPGGVGYDINCGVRLALIAQPYKDLTPQIRQALLQKIFSLVPSGVGRGRKEKGTLTEKDYSELLVQGARWSVARGYGCAEDIEHIESLGVLKNADPYDVSSEAKNRGKDQLGTIGSGNHFIEIGEVQTIFLPDVAKAWGVEAGHIYILIHTGSRGFGHQVCQDTLDSFFEAGYGEGLPDKQLVSAPIQSPMGQKYMRAMAAAANFAFNNRQEILHHVRAAFYEVCHIRHEKVRLLYDVCHNIAKQETHIVDGKAKELCIHRKGATRAFGPGAYELASIFQKTGQPVLVPGDMGRASHLMVGSGHPLTWCSACHGAGRAKSRIKCLQEWKGKDPIGHMHSQGISVLASSGRTVSEEMPDAYKDVDVVVRSVEEAGLARMVARLRPSLVIKG